jgi:hypothetical protein
VIEVEEKTVMMIVGQEGGATNLVGIGRGRLS